MAQSITVNWLRHLRYTPLRDLFRGRVSARLDWRRRLAEANLPPAAHALVEQVVRRTRLWRIEKADVADELIAHILDAQAAGASVDAIIAAFGGVSQTARLIRRAKIRSRALPWQLLRWMGRLLIATAVAYGVLAGFFLLSHPSVRVNYLAEINRPALAVPEADRAWPIYHKISTSMRSVSPTDGNAAHWPAFLSSDVDGKDWPQIQEWLAAHTADLESLRQATAKSAMGFVLGSAGATGEAKTEPNWREKPLLQVMLPHLSEVSHLARVLRADAKLAGLQHDAARAEADILALLRLADHVHQNDGLLITSLSAIAFRSMALVAAQRSLRSDVQDLSADQLVRLAHALSGPEVAADLVSLRDERALFYDVVQRVYTDDGNGSGHITADGLQFLDLNIEPVMQKADRNKSVPRTLRYAVGPGESLVFASRSEVVAEYDRLMDLSEENLRKPIREVDPRSLDHALARFHGPLLTTIKYAVLTAIIPSTSRCAPAAESYLGRRDGVVTAIALELYRRRTGAFPTTLDALVPEFLPRVPVDRITGDPIRYRLAESQPELFSVGPDPATGAKTGEWILYPQLRTDRD